MNRLRNERFTRRHLVQSGLLCSTGILLGCRDSESDLSQPVEALNRRAIPLRVLYVGKAEDIPLLERGWSSISEQPIEIRLVPFSREAITSISDPLRDAFAASDVAIVPLATLASIQHSQAAVALGDSLVQKTSEELGPLYPAVRNGAATIGGTMICLPLGARQSCFVAADTMDRIESWEAYDQIVQAWGGDAAEPTAEGWLAGSYLVRCVGIRDWLFQSESLEPLLLDSAYVESLSLMVKTCNRYQNQGQTPEQVWHAISAGEYRGGIAIPPMNLETPAVLSIHALPGNSTDDRVLLDPFLPVVTLSASCRQTAIARQFMVWLGGGDGSESVRSQVSGMGMVRMPTAMSSQRGTLISSDGYAQFLSRHLANPVTLPSLQLIQGERYYAALDRQVGLAISGAMKPAEALEKVCSEWNRLTDEIGREDQVRAWKRANGLRG